MMRTLSIILFIFWLPGFAKSDVTIPDSFDFAGINLVQFSEGSLGIQINLISRQPLYDQDLTDADKTELNGHMLALCWLYMTKVFEEIERTNDQRKFTHGIVSVTWRQAGLGNTVYVDRGWRSTFKLQGKRCGDGV